MGVCHLRNGISCNVTKLPDAMFIVESLPTLTNQYDIESGQSFTSVRITLLGLALIKHSANYSNECVWWNCWTWVRLSQNLIQSVSNPRPTGRTIMNVAQIAVLEELGDVAARPIVEMSNVPANDVRKLA